MVNLFATLPLFGSNWQLVGKMFSNSSSLCCWCAATLSKCCGWSFYLHPFYWLHTIHTAVCIQTPGSVSISENATETSNLPELHSSQACGVDRPTTSKIWKMPTTNVVYQSWPSLPWLRQLDVSAVVSQKYVKQDMCVLMHAYVDACISFHFWEPLEMPAKEAHWLMHPKRRP